MGRTPFFRGLSKTETRNHVREIVDLVGFNEEFTSEFIGDLIHQHHYSITIVAEPTSNRPSSVKRVVRVAGTILKVTLRVEAGIEFLGINQFRNPI